MAESSFPMSFDKCPHCGSTETITELAWQEEAEAGRVNEDTPVQAATVPVALVDPTKTIGITARILRLDLDYCAGCGAPRCVRASIQQGQVQMGPPPGIGRGGPGGQKPPFFKGS